MSEEPAPAEETEEPGARGPAAPAVPEAPEDAAPAGAAGEGGEPTGDGGGAERRLSEAEAELAAQRAERQRIEERRAARAAPVEAGTKLTGTAAELLAAVRAVESGATPPPTFDAPRETPAPRRSAPAPARPRAEQPVAAPPPAASALAAAAEALAEGSAPAALAGPAVRALGEGAGQVLREDPWQLLRVPGVRPEQADGFARALLGEECDPGDERRGRALCVRLLEQAARLGHTALDLPALVSQLASARVPGPEEAVHAAVAEGDLLLFQDALEAAPGPAPATPEEGEEPPRRPVRVLVGLERYAMAEESLADALGRIAGCVPKAETEEEAGWAPAARAAGASAGELIRAAAAHALVLHTGGESARAEPARLVTAARGLGLRAYAAAHTAQGRHRLAADLGVKEPALTVAGLLSGAQGPGRDAEGQFALDLLVVLDAPQLDVESAALLAESVPDGARLVLSGDPGVLGSAGPGRVFGDLLALRRAPLVVSRTPDPGPLGELVSGIGVGELGEVDAPGRELVMVPVRDPGEAVHRTVQLVCDSVPRALGVPAEETQVLVPGHGGAAGTRVLNAALKERLNPGPGRFAGFDPGDRVAYSPVPGRTALGRVVGADEAGLRLECEGLPVHVAKEEVAGLVRHGWAVTAHQSVGHRWPAVVAVLPGDATPVLTRPWVYTAFGRAARHLSVVQGVGEALGRAVAGAPAQERTTRLATLLREQAEPAAAG
ncbi:helix-hairpin-helix domain-containing protein [Streptomyces sp. NPDC007088]|uniref:helix-hairpin-helix domain-containing protein n=1 Tax=Streptomyces sp. NPDC007088 TaxID=3364773 RepID=UPI00368C9E59